MLELLLYLPASLLCFHEIWSKLYCLSFGATIIKKVLCILQFLSEYFSFHSFIHFILLQLQISFKCHF